MDHNNGIILIHGAGLNNSIWNDVVKEINIPLIMIDFPNKITPPNKVSTLLFNDYIKATVKQIKNWKHEQFIVVAHSIGAIVGLTVADQFKNQLKGFVAIGSVIPKSGDSFTSTLPFPQKLIMPILLNFFGTKPPSKTLEAELCNDLTPEQTHKIVNEFTPESKALYTTRIHFKIPNVHRLYIKMEHDNSIPANLQDKMASNLKADKIVSINSGHLPMISQPKQLTRILIEFMQET